MVHSVYYTHTSSLQRCINSTWQRSIKTTPFQLMFGTKMRNCSDASLVDLIDEEIRELFSVERDDAREQARESIAEMQKENQTTYNRKRKAANQHKEGDLVAIRRTVIPRTVQDNQSFKP